MSEWGSGFERWNWTYCCDQNVKDPASETWSNFTAIPGWTLRRQRSQRGAHTLIEQFRRTRQSKSAKGCQVPRVWWKTDLVAIFCCDLERNTYDWNMMRVSRFIVVNDKLEYWLRSNYREIMTVNPIVSKWLHAKYGAGAYHEQCK